MKEWELALQELQCAGMWLNVVGMDWILFGIQPVDIDGDGQMELVGQNKIEASNPAKNYFTIQVVELTTKKVKTKFVSY